jgi:hypothetical protein
MPLTAARRANSAGIESVGDLAKGREPGSLDRPHNRQDIGRKLIGCGAVRRMRLHRRLSGSRIARAAPAAFFAARAALVRVEISARSFSASAA